MKTFIQIALTAAIALPICLWLEVPTYVAFSIGCFVSLFVSMALNIAEKK